MHGAGYYLGISILVYCHAWDHWVEFDRIIGPRWLDFSWSGCRIMGYKQTEKHDSWSHISLCKLPAYVGWYERSEKKRRGGRKVKEAKTFWYVQKVLLFRVLLLVLLVKIQKGTLCQALTGRGKKAKKGKKRRKVKANLGKKKEKRKAKTSQKRNSETKKTRERNQAVTRWDVNEWDKTNEEMELWLKQMSKWWTFMLATFFRQWETLQAVQWEY